MVYLHEKCKVRHIANEKYYRHPVSRTFHGRDIFAPVGAHLAAGVPPSRMGKLIQDYLRGSFEKPQRTGKRTWTGRILRIDGFGNIITSFHAIEFPDLDRKNFWLAIGPRQIGVMAHNYAECGPGELFVIAGSSGYLEVSVSQGSAAKAIGCETGAPAELTIG
jgi:S-adenosylmethionine hydrolase